MGGVNSGDYPGRCARNGERRVGPTRPTYPIQDKAGAPSPPLALELREERFEGSVAGGAGGEPGMVAVGAGEQDERLGAGGRAVEQATALEGHGLVGRTVAKQLGHSRQRGDLGAGIVGLGQQPVERQVRIEPAGEIRGREEAAVHDQARGRTILRELDGNGARADIEAELGDVLFALANFGRHLGIDPDGAVRVTNEKFRRRFAYIERKLGEVGRSPRDASLAEMEALWQEAKTGA